MLPDLDSGSSIIAREGTALASALVPILLLHQLYRVGMPFELIFISGAITYLLVRFSLAILLRRFTHRGILHSLLAAVVFSAIAFLFLSGESILVRLFQSSAVILGYVSHLVLDELWSVEYHRGRFRLKRSFGSALKLLRRKR